jgi:Lipocalin-like domain
MKRIVSFIYLFMTTNILFSQSSGGSTITKDISIRDLVGTWDLVTVKSIAADSSITYPYGEHPAGLLIFSAGGEYALQIYSHNRSKIASGNKSTATPEENGMMVKGSNAHFGKYKLDAASKTITYSVESAFFPNWEGQELKASVTLENNIFTSYAGFTTFGAAKAVVIWKKR